MNVDEDDEIMVVADVGPNVAKGGGEGGNQGGRRKVSVH